MIIIKVENGKKTLNTHTYTRSRKNEVSLNRILFDSNQFHEYKMLKATFYVDHSKSVFPIRYFCEKRYCKNNNNLKSIHILKKKKK